MITILAEKPDVGNKIAAALGGITLSNGKKVTFETLKANEKAVKSQQAKEGMLMTQFNGKEVAVTWGYGHLVELKQAKDYNSDYAQWSKIPLPFFPENYELQLKTAATSDFSKRIKTQFGIIKKLFNSSEYVINATDFDREGEVIFSYIYELAKCKKSVKRACFASQTKEGIIDAFNSLKDGKDMKCVEAAGRMRSIADWVVGANLTVAMTLNQRGKVLSIGRVQTPTLKILVDRELSIKNFKPEEYWTIDSEFTTDNGEIFKATHEAKRFSKKSEAEAVLKKVSGAPNGIITNISSKRSNRDVPQLYSLAALQMDANSEFGYTLKETLEAVQELYDGGYTTYPRTDSRYLTEDMEPTVNKVLDSLQKRPVYRKLIEGKTRKFDKAKYFNDKKVESHFAIIPTGTEPTSLGERNARIYDLICKSVITMLYGPATIENSTVNIDVSGENFVATGSRIVNRGFMEVTGNTKENFLPDMKKGDHVVGKYSSLTKQTEPPKHYSDKTLLAAMISAGKDLEDEDLKKILSDPSVAGIGTPSTRDAIIETLITRGYVERNKKSLVATEKGISLISVLPVNEVKSPEMTAKWEQRLHEIERGKEDSVKFEKDIRNSVTEWCNAIAKTERKEAFMENKDALNFNCPVCGKPMVKYGWGFGCSGYKDGCKFSVGTICEKKLSEAQVKKLLTSKDTGIIKGFKSKSGKTFDARLLLNDENKIEFKFE